MKLNRSKIGELINHMESEREVFYIEDTLYQIQTGKICEILLRSNSTISIMVKKENGDYFQPEGGIYLELSQAKEKVRSNLEGYLENL